MLYGLVGSRSVEKILLFLFVNEKGYASQLHRVLNTPLTPIQKALERLEREGILKSIYEGKTRFFMFNPHYHLLKELEALLKKTFTLLTPREKSHYYFIHHVPREQKAQITFLYELWKQMRQVRQVTFQFRSQDGKKGYGRGDVSVDYDGDATVIFKEKGEWEGLEDQKFCFRNTFRWTFNRIDGMLTLEHLRFGINNPVFLFHLVPAAPKVLESLHAHLCGQDTYFGHLVSRGNSIQLTWRILGPKKNEEVTYIYS